MLTTVLEGDSHPSWETEEGVTPQYMGQAGDTNTDSKRPGLQSGGSGAETA